MFGWKKKTTEAPQEKPVCNHVYKDFPWYIDANYLKYSSGDSEYTCHIIEPYVCIYCGDRKDVTLETVKRDNISFQTAEKILDDIEANYAGHVRPRAVIEDMIHDMRFVDRQTLYWYEMLHKTPEGSPFKKGETK